MRSVTRDKFLSWAKSKGVVLDKHYDPPQCLVYQGLEEDLRVSMPLRENVRRWLNIIHYVFGLFSSNTSIWIWKRGPRWDLDRMKPPADMSSLLPLIIKTLGVTKGNMGALRFSKREWRRAQALILANQIGSGGVGTDVFVVPDDASHIVQFEHHDYVQVICKSPRSALAAALYLRKKGVGVEPSVDLLKVHGADASGGKSSVKRKKKGTGKRAKRQ